MDYYCDMCDKKIMTRRTNKHLKRLCHIEFDKCMRIKHTVENPGLLDIDELFDVYITHPSQKKMIYTFLKMILSYFLKEIFIRTLNLSFNINERFFI